MRGDALSHVIEGEAALMVPPPPANKSAVAWPELPSVDVPAIRLGLIH